MKKSILLILTITISIFLSGCLHEKSNKTTPSIGSVAVEGNIKNVSIVWQNYIPDFISKAFAATMISTRSNLIVTDPTRYADISKSIGIQIDANLINNSNVSINGYKIDIFIEDEQFLTKESWSCNVCYSIDGGSECESLNEIEGNTLFSTNQDPILPSCDSSIGSPSLCVTQFNNNPDCANPTYKYIYQDKGKGLQEFNMSNINVQALSNLVSTIGAQSNGWLIGIDKYARFIVYDEFSVEVFRKDYVFNVIN